MGLSLLRISGQRGIGRLGRSPRVRIRGAGN